MTSNFQGGYRQRDFDRNDRRRGYGGFGDFGGPLIGGFAGSLLGNALFPGYGYGYGYGGHPYYGYPYYGYPSYGYPSYGFPPYGNPYGGY